jgi:SAM-dependent methyltransferase
VVRTVDRQPDWVPAGTDFERASIARVYDYYLGGSHNFEVDRRMGDRILGQVPDIAVGARASRSFLRRVIRYLTDRGIRQFLDVGSGLPAGNTHEIARRMAPDCRVAYVDVELTAVAHGRAMLADDPLSTMVMGDVREPERILADPDVAGLLDLEAPIAVLMVAVLAYLPASEDAVDLIRRYRDVMAPGSYLALAVPTRDEGGPEYDWGIRRNLELVFHPRTPHEVTKLVEGMELVEPGLVNVALWRPDGYQESDSRVLEMPGLVGVARRT